MKGSWLPQKNDVEGVGVWLLQNKRRLVLVTLHAVTIGFNEYVGEEDSDREDLIWAFRLYGLL